MGSLVFPKPSADFAWRLLKFHYSNFSVLEKLGKKPLREKEAQHRLGLAWQASAHFRNLRICEHGREIAHQKYFC